MAEDQGKKDQLVAAAQEALLSDQIPHHYGNSFVTGLGNGDTFIVIFQNGRAIGSINLSYTVAKTLSNQLGKMISDLEKNSNNTIMTTSEIEKALNL